MRRLTFALTFLLLFTAGRPAQAEAQVVATLRWQTKPYCNVLALTFVQQGGMYQVTGTDDQCGSAVATVSGSAVPAGANVAAGLTVSLPSGRGAPLTASIRLSDASGTWADADGNSGAFVLNATGGSTPRPAPVPPAANSRLLSAFVDQDGVLARGSQVVSTTRVATGLYAVFFNRPVDTCTYVATLGGPLGAVAANRGVAAVSNGGNGVGVITYNATTVVDNGFSLVVVCP